MGALSLGQDIGLALSGGDIDREGARLDGLNLGSQIESRKASTVNALAQARLRKDEADARLVLVDKMKLGGFEALAAVHQAGGKMEDFTGATLDQQRHQGLMDLPEALAGGGTGAIAGSVVAGANPEQVSGAVLDQQIGGLRDVIADPTKAMDVRQAAGHAVKGGVVDPFQISDGLFADIWNPGDSPEVAPESLIDTANTAAQIRQRQAAADLSDARADDLGKTKSSSDPDAIIQHFLGDDGQGTSVIPDDLNLEAAFGADAFVAGPINAMGDFFFGNTPMPDAARSQEIMQELSSRIQLGMLTDLPGISRPNIRILELLKVYSEDPRELFRGNQAAVNNLTSTLAASRRNLEDIKLQISSPSNKNNSDQFDLEGALIKTAHLVADLEKAMAIVQAGKSRKRSLAEDVTPGPRGMPEGWTYDGVVSP